MNTQNDGWIKMSERKPTASECEAGVTIGRWKGGKWQTDNGWHHDEWGPGWTHFHVPRLPEPPKKEQTQRELDEEAFQGWYDETPDHLTALGHVWHAALAYRDKQNAEDVKNLWISPDMPHATCDAIKNLRRRCGLDT